MLTNHRQPNEHVLASERENFVRCLHLLSCTHESQEAEGFITNALGAVKRTFDELTGDRCACTLKMCSHDGTVSTWLRDRESPPLRYSAVCRFPSQLNSAFRELQCSRKFTYYLSNNLTADRTYENVNPDWKDHYNAVLVASIRSNIFDHTRSADIMGFLCVDNFHGGFTTLGGVALSSFAHDLFNAISSVHWTMNSGHSN